MKDMNSFGSCKALKHVFWRQNLPQRKEALKRSAEFSYVLPAVLEAGQEVEVLAEYLVSPEKEDGHGGEKVIAAVRRGNLLGTAFHPELTADSRCHSYFLKMAREVEGGTSNSIVTIASSFDLSLNIDEHAVNDLPIFE